MTDVIFEGKDGTTMHKFIHDGLPYVVYVREGGTIKVERYDSRVDEALRHVKERVVLLGKRPLKP